VVHESRRFRSRDLTGKSNLRYENCGHQSRGSSTSSSLGGVLGHKPITVSYALARSGSTTLVRS
jgi:hypothetical protein